MLEIRFAVDYFLYCQKNIIFASKTKNMAVDNNLNRLKVVLCEKKRTSKWLAQQLGVNPTTVSKWCTNTIQPDLYTIAKIADLLQGDKRELLQSSN